MKISVVRNYDFPDFFHQTPNSSGIWKNHQYLLGNSNDVDLLICINPPLQDIKTTIPKENRWLIIQEPPVNGNAWMKKSFSHFGKVISQFPEEEINSLQSALPWHINKSYDELIGMSCPIKTDNVSAIVSNYKNLPIQQKRFHLLKHLKTLSFDFDFFGKGHNYIKNKEDALFPYKYSICIENSAHPNYWTEKIVDCYLCFTMPIYYGCPNIEDYFHKDSFIALDIDDPEKSMVQIEKAIEEKRWEKNFTRIVEARNNILSNYQFFPWVGHIIEKNFRPMPKLSEEFIIPKNPPPSTMIQKIRKYGKKLF